MQTERWERIRTIFSGALDCNTRDRAAFVQSACTQDVSLRAEVESLLTAHVDAGAFLEGSALAVVPPPSVIDYSTSEHRVGAYRIVRAIGHGGMRAVYLAERADHQYNKRVAIKVVSRGLDTEMIIRRFRHERQILADLDHPNIARLLEGGTTDDGLPYFVMEYIEGEPTTHYCDTRQLSLRDRLVLFRSVCAAVHYAHQHLVVHCDIKPGNILVTGDGTPKLLDFGIARLLNAGDKDSTAIAVHGRAMTMEYASPEQLQGATMTTLTDVYSLGVVLYELLTGRPPFEYEAGAAHTPEEIGAARAATVPAPPSARITRGPPAYADMGHSSRAPQRSIRGDLDSISLKALDATPEQRYASAQQFSDDIRRYLNRQPVIARPSTLAYRSVQLVRRNALASAAVSILIVALLGGITATTWQAHIADEQRRTAERRFNDVRSLAITLVSEVNDSIASLPGTTNARRLIVVRALESLDALARDARGDRGLQYDLASAYLKVGDVQGRPYGPNLGETSAALQSYGKARGVLESLVAADPRNLKAREELSLAEERIGAVYLRARDWVNGERYERLATALSDALLRTDPGSEPYQRELSDALIYLGDALAASDDQWSVGRIRAARDSYSRALAIRQTLAARGPMSPASRSGLISAYNRMGYTGSSLWKITGDVRELRGALLNHRQSERIRLDLLSSNPGSTASRRLVADGWMDIAQVQQELGDMRGALASFDSAGPVFQSLADVDRANVEARRDLAYYHENVGGALLDAALPAEAARHERIALAMLAAVQHADPASHEEYFHLAHAGETLASAMDAQGATAAALAAYSRVLVTLRQWTLAEPNNVRAVRLSTEVNQRIARLRAVGAR